MSEYRFKTPLTEADMRQLHIGDSVLLDGIIFGIRDGNMIRVFDQKVAPPVDWRGAALLHTAAFRLLRAARDDSALPDLPDLAHGGRRSFWLERSAASPVRAGDQRDRRAEADLREILVDQDVAAGEVIVLRRRVENDAAAQQRLTTRALRPHPRPGPAPDWVQIAAVQLAEGKWLVARVLIPPGERMIVATLIGQTLLIYAVLVGAIAFIVRRITRPL